MKKILTITLLSTYTQTIVNREWTQLAGVPDPLSISTSCIDYQNNIITASSNVVAGQDANISVIKYDMDGNLLWQNSFNGISNGKDYATSVKTDSFGNVYVIGTTFNVASNYDFILIKYNAQGVQQWQQIYNGQGNNIDIPTAIAFDNSNNVYITGASTGTNSLTDYATIKYSSAGVQQWVSTYDYALGYEAPAGIEVNPITNNIFITGASASTQASNDWDYATVEYNSSGTQLNVNRVVSAGNGLDKPTAISRDNAGNIYVTGSYFNIANNSYDIKTIKLNSNLMLQWTMTFNGGFGFYCDILSNSWGGETSDPAIKQSVKLAFDNHCVFIASRVNRYKSNPSSDNEKISYPACYKDEWVMNIGSSGNDGLHKTTTNGDIGPNLNLGGYYEAMYSKGVDVIAPGSSDIVLTTKPINSFNSWEYIPDDNYTWFNGSSASAPHVAGLAALMLSHHAFGNYPNRLDDGDIQYLIKNYAFSISSQVIAKP